MAGHGQLRHASQKIKKKSICNLYSTKFGATLPHQAILYSFGSAINLARLSVGFPLPAVAYTVGTVCVWKEQLSGWVFPFTSLAGLQTTTLSTSAYREHSKGLAQG